MTDKRAGDRTGLRAAWGRWGASVTTFLALCVSGWAVHIATDVSKDSARTAQEAKHAVLEIRAESRQRIDDTCRINETRQKTEVDALKRTYEYLGGLTAQQLAEPLNKAVLAGLPATVRAALTDDAPAYCDKPGVGLPEPDPVVPRRPKSLPPA